MEAAFSTLKPVALAIAIVAGIALHCTPPARHAAGAGPEAALVPAAAPAAEAARCDDSAANPVTAPCDIAR